jgi:DUF1680 family protein
MENHAKYADSIYFHDADSLYVNLFLPSVLDWQAKGLTITQETRFPEAETTRLTIKADRPAQLTLNIRRPDWCPEISWKVNGRSLPAKPTPEGYLQVEREWRTGDVVEVSLPMSIRTEALPGAPGTVAILYGPIVLAGALGSAGIAPGSDLIVSERDYGTVFPETAAVPTLAVAPEKLREHIVPVAGPPLTFRTVGIGRPDEVTLMPYFRIAHQHYNLYWTTSS